MKINFNHTTEKPLKKLLSEIPTGTVFAGTLIDPCDPSTKYHDGVWLRMGTDGMGDYKRAGMVTKLNGPGDFAPYHGGLAPEGMWVENYIELSAELTITDKEEAK